MTDFVSCDGFTCAADAAELLASAGLKSFDDFIAFPGGERICHKRGRSVYRFEIGERAFYLKRNLFHKIEFWKGLSRFRLPPHGAWVEWRNILAIRDAGVPTIKPIAYGEKQICGVEVASFGVTEELYGAEPLDDFIGRELVAPLTAQQVSLKRRLILKTAALVKRFHAQGMNHQDLYLNHFFIDPDENLHLLDLQRVQRRTVVPKHYLIKDLGQLTFSSLRFPVITDRDRLRFISAYLGESLSNARGRSLIKGIISKVRAISRHDVKLTARRRQRGEMQ